MNPEIAELVAACKHALLDIAFLLEAGFDTNIHDTDMDSVKDTIKELKAVIGQHDPEWELP